MKISLVIVFVATIVTTQSLDLQDRAKVLVYEVIEREGDTPHIELLKVDDVNVPFDDKNLNQLLQLDNNQNQNRGISIKKNRNRSRDNLNKFIDLYGSQRYKDNSKYRLKHRVNNQFKSYKNLNRNYRSKKNSQSQKVNRIVDLESLLNNRDSHHSKQDRQYSSNYRDIKSNQYSQDNQYSNQDYQYSNKDDAKKQNSLWQDQIANYIQQQSDKIYNIDKKNEKLSQRVKISEDYIDLNADDEDRDEHPDILLSRLLKPHKRDRRESERLSIVQRMRQLIKRLKKLDSDADARLEGQIYVANLDDLSKLENKGVSLESQDKTSQRLSVDDLIRALEVKQYENPFLTDNVQIED